mmetsp:Transcript_105925/g.252727  ORF Transcript_105925/g.252727 Transcript_105925/m.252727 type:complete len:96 (+) Transcript_105925:531-818(+)
MLASEATWLCDVAGSAELRKQGLDWQLWKARRALTADLQVVILAESLPLALAQRTIPTQRLLEVPDDFVLCHGSWLFVSEATRAPASMGYMAVCQ